MQEVYEPYCCGSREKDRGDRGRADRGDREGVERELSAETDGGKEEKQEEEEGPRARLLTVYIEEAHASDEW